MMARRGKRPSSEEGNLFPRVKVVNQNQPQERGSFQIYILQEYAIYSTHQLFIVNWRLRSIVKMRDRDKLIQGVFSLPCLTKKKLWICQKLILKKGDTMNILGGENEKTCISAHGRTSIQFLSGKVKTIYPNTPFHAFLRVRELWTEYQLTIYHLSAHWRRHHVYIAFLGPSSRQSLPFKANEVSVHSFANVLGGEECWISRCKRTLVSELEVYLVMGEGRGKVAEERDVTWAKLVRKGLDMHPKQDRTNHPGWSSLQRDKLSHAWSQAMPGPGTSLTVAVVGGAQVAGLYGEALQCTMCSL